MISRILVLILSLIIGILCIKYSYTMVKWFGHTDWVERRLGIAFSYSLWKLIGLIIIALGGMYGFGVIK